MLAYVKSYVCSNYYNYVKKTSNNLKCMTVTITTKPSLYDNDNDNE